MQDVEIALKDHGPEIKTTMQTLIPQDGEWYSYFNNYLHSNNVTRNLIPAAVEATALAIELDREDW